MLRSVRSWGACGAAAVSVLAAAMSSAAEPSCTTLSRTAVANLVGIGAMVLDRTIGPYCTFVGAIPNHYVPMLKIGILPYSTTIWEADIAAQHAVDHYNKTLVFAQHVVTSSSMSLCSAGTPATPTGLGPHCNPQPSETVIVASRAWHRGSRATFTSHTRSR
jgi:hypothetical protein